MGAFAEWTTPARVQRVRGAVQAGGVAVVVAGATLAVGGASPSPAVVAAGYLLALVAGAATSLQQRRSFVASPVSVFVGYVLGGALAVTVEATLLVAVVATPVDLAFYIAGLGLWDSALFVGFALLGAHFLASMAWSFA